MTTSTRREALSVLGERMLRQLGFASSGQGAAHHLNEMYEYLRASQVALMIELPAQETRETFFGKITGIDQTLYDLESGVDPDTLHNVTVGEVDGSMRKELRRGITNVMRGSTCKGRPSHYELVHGSSGGIQIEVFPVPDSPYALGYDYHILEGRFSEPNDLTTLNSELVYTYALANAMEAYSHPRAGSVGAQASKMLGSIRAAANRGKKITRGKNKTFRDKVLTKV